MKFRNTTEIGRKITLLLMTQTIDNKSVDSNSRMNTKQALLVPEGNPQGKGVVGFLQDWQNIVPKTKQDKSLQQVLLDYLASVIVLDADLRFKPVVDTTYYLYANIDSKDVISKARSPLSLSMIQPEQWTEQHQERFVGTCSLREDMTWSLQLSENATNTPKTFDYLMDLVVGFEQHLASHTSLDTALPNYNTKATYYSRLLASGLSMSLQQSFIELPKHTLLEQKTRLPNLLAFTKS
ncbi:MAG: hypothetical protein AAGB12_15475 [Pseudomonadota bacterium]